MSYPNRQLPPLGGPFYNQSALPPQFGGNWLAQGGAAQSGFQNAWDARAFDRNMGAWRMGQYGQVPQFSGAYSSQFPEDQRLPPMWRSW